MGFQIYNGLRFVTDVQKLSLQADVPSLAAMDRFAEANYELLRAENAFLIGDSGIPPFRGCSLQGNVERC